MVHQPAAGAEQVVAGADQAVGLEHHAADRHLVDHLGRAGRQAQHVAVLDQHRVRHAHLLRQALVRVQVARLAMHRHRDLRLDPAVHLLELVAAGMAGDVDEMVALGDHLDALAGPAGCAGCRACARCRG